MSDLCALVIAMVLCWLSGGLVGWAWGARHRRPGLILSALFVVVAAVGVRGETIPPIPPGGEFTARVPVPQFVFDPCAPGSTWVEMGGNRYLSAIVYPDCYEAEGPDGLAGKVVYAGKPAPPEQTEYVIIDGRRHYMGLDLPDPDGVWKGYLLHPLEHPHIDGCIEVCCEEKQIQRWGVVMTPREWRFTPEDRARDRRKGVPCRAEVYSQETWNARETPKDDLALADAKGRVFLALLARIDSLEARILRALEQGEVTP